MLPRQVAASAIALLAAAAVSFPAVAAAAPPRQPVRVTGGGAQPAARRVVTTTVFYGSNPADTMTTYAPASGRVPGVVFVHGGAWQRSQPTANEFAFAKALAAREDWVVSVIGYPTRLARAWVVEPSAVRRAIDVVAHRADVAHHKVAVWGESAGGMLSLLSSYQDAALKHSPVQAVVSVSGPTDMRMEFGSLAQAALGAVTSFERLTPGVAHRLGLQRYRDTSPVDLVRRGDPATFQAISRHDPLVPPAEVRELSGKLRQAHVPHRTVFVPGDGHSSVIEPEVPASGSPDVEQLAIQFLKEAFASR